MNIDEDIINFTENAVKRYRYYRSNNYKRNVLKCDSYPIKAVKMTIVNYAAREKTTYIIIIRREKALYFIKWFIYLLNCRNYRNYRNRISLVQLPKFQMIHRIIFIFYMKIYIYFYSYLISFRLLYRLLLYKCSTYVAKIFIHNILNKVNGKLKNIFIQDIGKEEGKYKKTCAGKLNKTLETGCILDNYKVENNKLTKLLKKNYYLYFVSSKFYIDNFLCIDQFVHVNATKGNIAKCREEKFRRMCYLGCINNMHVNIGIKRVKEKIPCIITRSNDNEPYATKESYTSGPNENEQTPIIPHLVSKNGEHKKSKTFKKNNKNCLLYHPNWHNEIKKSSRIYPHSINISNSNQNYLNLSVKERDNNSYETSSNSEEVYDDIIYNPFNNLNKHILSKVFIERNTILFIDRLTKKTIKTNIIYYWSTPPPFSQITKDFYKHNIYSAVLMKEHCNSSETIFLICFNIFKIIIHKLKILNFFVILDLCFKVNVLKCDRTRKILLQIIKNICFNNLNILKLYIVIKSATSLNVSQVAEVCYMNRYKNLFPIFLNHFPVVSHVSSEKTDYLILCIIKCPMLFPALNRKRFKSSRSFPYQCILKIRRKFSKSFRLLFIYIIQLNIKRHYKIKFIPISSKVRLKDPLNVFMEDNHKRDIVKINLKYSTGEIHCIIMETPLKCVDNFIVYRKKKRKENHINNTTKQMNMVGINIDIVTAGAIEFLPISETHVKGKICYNLIRNQIDISILVYKYCDISAFKHVHMKTQCVGLSEETYINIVKVGPISNGNKKKTSDSSKGSDNRKSGNNSQSGDSGKSPDNNQSGDTGKSPDNNQSGDSGKSADKSQSGDNGKNRGGSGNNGDDKDDEKDKKKNHEDDKEEKKDDTKENDKKRSGSNGGNEKGGVNARTNGNRNGKTNGNRNGKTNGNRNGKPNGDISGSTNGDISGKTNGDISGKTNGDISGSTNGSMNGNTETRGKNKKGEKGKNKNKSKGENPSGGLLLNQIDAVRDDTVSINNDSPVLNNEKKETIKRKKGNKIGKKNCNNEKNDKYSLNILIAENAYKIIKNGRVYKKTEPVFNFQTHQTFILKEMMWMSIDYYEERRWKKNVSKRFSYQVNNHFEERKKNDKHFISSQISNDIKMFWFFILNEIRPDLVPVDVDHKVKNKNIIKKKFFTSIKKNFKMEEKNLLNNREKISSSINDICNENDNEKLIHQISDIEQNKSNKITAKDSNSNSIFNVARSMFSLNFMSKKKDHQSDSNNINSSNSSNISNGENDPIISAKSKENKNDDSYEPSHEEKGIKNVGNSPSSHSTNMIPSIDKEKAESNTNQIRMDETRIMIYQKYEESLTRLEENVNRELLSRYEYDNRRFCGYSENFRFCENEYSSIINYNDGYMDYYSCSNDYLDLSNHLYIYCLLFISITLIEVDENIFNKNEILLNDDNSAYSDAERELWVPLGGKAKLMKRQNELNGRMNDELNGKLVYTKHEKKRRKKKANENNNYYNNTIDVYEQLEEKEPAQEQKYHLQENERIGEGEEHAKSKDQRKHNKTIKLEIVKQECKSEVEEYDEDVYKEYSMNFSEYQQMEGGDGFHHTGKGNYFSHNMNNMDYYHDNVKHGHKYMLTTVTTSRNSIDVKDLLVIPYSTVDSIINKETSSNTMSEQNLSEHLNEIKQRNVNLYMNNMELYGAKTYPFELQHINRCNKDIHLPLMNLSEYDEHTFFLYLFYLKSAPYIIKKQIKKEKKKRKKYFTDGAAAKKRTPKRRLLNKVEGEKTAEIIEENENFPTNEQQALTQVEEKNMSQLNEANYIAKNENQSFSSKKDEKKNVSIKKLRLTTDCGSKNDINNGETNEINNDEANEINNGETNEINNGEMNEINSGEANEINNGEMNEINIDETNGMNNALGEENAHVEETKEGLNFAEELEEHNLKTWMSKKEEWTNDEVNFLLILTKTYMNYINIDWVKTNWNNSDDYYPIVDSNNNLTVTEKNYMEENLKEKGEKLATNCTEEGIMMHVESSENAESVRHGCSTLDGEEVTQTFDTRPKGTSHADDKDKDNNGTNKNREANTKDDNQINNESSGKLDKERKIHMNKLNETVSNPCKEHKSVYQMVRVQSTENMENAKWPLNDISKNTNHIYNINWNIISLALTSYNKINHVYQIIRTAEDCKDKFFSLIKENMYTSVKCTNLHEENYLKGIKKFKKSSKRLKFMSIFPTPNANSLIGSFNKYMSETIERHRLREKEMSSGCNNNNLVVNPEVEPIDVYQISPRKDTNGELHQMKETNKSEKGMRDNNGEETELNDKNWESTTTPFDENKKYELLNERILDEFSKEDDLLNVNTSLSSNPNNNCTEENTHHRINKCKEELNGTTLFCKNTNLCTNLIKDENIFNNLFTQLSSNSNETSEEDTDCGKDSFFSPSDLDDSMTLDLEKLSPVMSEHLRNNMENKYLFENFKEHYNQQDHQDDSDKLLEKTQNQGSGEDEHYDWLAQMEQMFEGKMRNNVKDKYTHDAQKKLMKGKEKKEDIIQMDDNVKCSEGTKEVDLLLYNEKIRDNENFERTNDESINVEYHNNHKKNNVPLRIEIKSENIEDKNNEMIFNADGCLLLDFDDKDNVYVSNICKNSGNQNLGYSSIYNDKDAKESITQKEESDGFDNLKKWLNSICSNKKNVDEFLSLLKNDYLVKNKNFYKIIQNFLNKIKPIVGYYDNLLDSLNNECSYEFPKNEHMNGFCSEKIDKEFVKFIKKIIDYDKKRKDKSIEKLNSLSINNETYKLNEFFIYAPNESYKTVNDFAQQILNYIPYVDDKKKINIKKIRKRYQCKNLISQILLADYILDELKNFPIKNAYMPSTYSKVYDNLLSEERLKAYKKYISENLQRYNNISKMEKCCTHIYPEQKDKELLLNQHMDTVNYQNETNIKIKNMNDSNAPLDELSQEKDDIKISRNYEHTDLLFNKDSQIIDNVEMWKGRQDGEVHATNHVHIKNEDSTETLTFNKYENNQNVLLPKHVQDVSNMTRTSLSKDEYTKNSNQDVVYMKSDMEKTNLQRQYDEQVEYIKQGEEGNHSLINTMGKNISGQVINTQTHNDNRSLGNTTKDEELKIEIGTNPSSSNDINICYNPYYTTVDNNGKGNGKGSASVRGSGNNNGGGSGGSNGNGSGSCNGKGSDQDNSKDIVPMINEEMEKTDKEWIKKKKLFMFQTKSLNGISNETCNIDKQMQHSTKSEHFFSNRQKSMPIKNIVKTNKITKYKTSIGVSNFSGEIVKSNNSILNYFPSGNNALLNNSTLEKMQMKNDLPMNNFSLEEQNGTYFLEGDTNIENKNYVSHEKMANVHNNSNDMTVLPNVSNGHYTLSHDNDKVIFSNRKQKLFSAKFNSTPNKNTTVENLTNCLANQSVIPVNPIASNHITSNHITSNPIIANSITSNPIIASPITSNPIIANPITSNPIIASPITSNPIITNAITSNPITAIPITDYYMHNQSPSKWNKCLSNVESIKSNVSTIPHQQTQSWSDVQFPTKEDSPSISNNQLRPSPNLNDSNNCNIIGVNNGETIHSSSKSNSSKNNNSKSNNSKSNNSKSNNSKSNNSKSNSQKSNSQKSNNSKNSRTSKNSNLSYSIVHNSTGSCNNTGLNYIGLPAISNPNCEEEKFLSPIHVSPQSRQYIPSNDTKGQIVHNKPSSLCCESMEMNSMKASTNSLINSSCNSRQMEVSSNGSVKKIQNTMNNTLNTENKMYSTYLENQARGGLTIASGSPSSSISKINDDSFSIKSGTPSNYSIGYGTNQALIQEMDANSRILHEQMANNQDILNSDQKYFIDINNKSSNMTNYSYNTISRYSSNNLQNMNSMSSDSRSNIVLNYSHPNFSTVNTNYIPSNPIHNKSNSSPNNGRSAFVHQPTHSISNLVNINNNTLDNVELVNFSNDSFNKNTICLNQNNLINDDNGEKRNLTSVVAKNVTDNSAHLFQTMQQRKIQTDMQNAIPDNHKVQQNYANNSNGVGSSFSNVTSNNIASVAGNYVDTNALSTVSPNAQNTLQHPHVHVNDQKNNYIFSVNERDPNNYTSLKNPGANVQGLSQQPLNQQNLNLNKMNSPNMKHNNGNLQNRKTGGSVNSYVNQMNFILQVLNQLNANSKSHIPSNVNRPETGKTTLEKPGSSKPIMNMPNMSCQSVNQPSFCQPSLIQPSMSQPNMSQPNMSQPNMSQPSMSQPSMSHPIMSQSNINQQNLTAPIFCHPSNNTTQNGNKNMNLPPYDSPSIKGKNAKQVFSDNNINNPNMVNMGVKSNLSKNIIHKMSQKNMFSSQDMIQQKLLQQQQELLQQKLQQQKMQQELFQKVYNDKDNHSNTPQSAFQETPSQCPTDSLMQSDKIRQQKLLQNFQQEQIQKQLQQLHSQQQFQVHQIQQQVHSQQSSSPLKAQQLHTQQMHPHQMHNQQLQQIQMQKLQYQQQELKKHMEQLQQKIPISQQKLQHLYNIKQNILLSEENEKKQKHSMQISIPLNSHVPNMHTLKQINSNDEPVLKENLSNNIGTNVSPSINSNMGSSMGGNMGGNLNESALYIINRKMSNNSNNLSNSENFYNYDSFQHSIPPNKIDVKDMRIHDNKNINDNNILLNPSQSRDICNNSISPHILSNNLFPYISPNSPYKLNYHNKNKMNNNQQQQ
ncbi:hypothetical protein, conserved [Plasmodium gonderi]|uniref:HSA domain-containing protein n=1 Tax=Plasmodium gonderi TaxID=77519 RepID=A0A1Y1JLB5_PLAGO|nr:hypothetical protein, conserved [Plasmodium gonderi]GAW83040.1 hypothetical protein, conserved [Plasmodium gonderi]